MRRPLQFVNPAEFFLDLLEGQEQAEMKGWGTQQADLSSLVRGTRLCSACRCGI